MTVSRRNALRFGLSALATALVGPQSASGNTVIAKPAKACILLFMHGGPSQLDTFDPKPGRPTGGEVRSIRTRIPGVHFSENLPGLAARADQLAVVRSLNYREGNHARARYLMRTGYVPQGAIKHPAFGAQVADTREAGGDLPRYVAVGGPGHTSGFLGPALTPFVVRDPRKPVRNLALAQGVDDARLDRRLTMWRQLQEDFARERNAPAVSGHEDIVEQAVRLMRSPRLKAFDIEQEPDKVRARYGDTKFGQSCLMARRLVERGVPFVEVMQQNWDTHYDNFGRTRTLCQEMDPGFSALLDDLAASGRLDETLIVWLGDFGRTPDINARGGRDHFPNVANAVLAGGGIQGGQVIGATDVDGYAVSERPVGVQDLFRTIALRLGVDPDGVHMSEGRPISIVDGGTAISELA